MSVVSKKSRWAIYLVVFDLIILNLLLVINPFIFGKSIELHLKLLFYLTLHSVTWLITYSLIVNNDLYQRDGLVERIINITFQVMLYSVLSFILIPNRLYEKEWSEAMIEKGSILFGFVIAYFILYKILFSLRKKGRYTKKSIIIGNNSTAYLLRDVLLNNPILGYKFKGFISNSINEENEVIHEIEDKIIQLKEAGEIDLVFIVISIFDDNRNLRRVLEFLINQGVKSFLVPKRENLLNQSNRASKVGDITIIDPLNIPLNRLKNKLLKRTFDIVFSFLVVVFILSWLIPLISLLIKIESKGPVFFIQQRTGVNNQSFWLIKFRSMTISTKLEGVQATKNDVRITILGKYLRMFNLDEMPQFLNVLWGNMSIVGPRPHMLEHTKIYSRSIYYYNARLSIKPGITGLAQINGFRGETKEQWKMEQRVKYDLDYIENWSFKSDIQIIIKTLFSKKSYLNAY